MSDLWSDPDPDQFDDGQLIELVRQYPIIWSKKYKDDRDKVMMGNAWTKISEIMHSTDEMCEQRWHDIRRRFQMEKQLSIQKKRSRSSFRYIITWPHYNACLFLNEGVIARE